MADQKDTAAVFLQSRISAHVLDEPERAGQQRRVQVFRRARRCVDALGVLVGWKHASLASTSSVCWGPAPARRC